METTPLWTPAQLIYDMVDENVFVVLNVCILIKIRSSIRSHIRYLRFLILIIVQIAINCWAKADILSAFLLARHASTNDVSPISFCSLGQRNCQPLFRCWSNARSPISPAFANVIPTILFQVSRWANVGPT